MSDVLTPQQRHRCMSTYTQQGDEAGNGCEEMAVGAWIPIQAECEECAGQAGHCDAEVSNGDICQRLFLART